MVTVAPREIFSNHSFTFTVLEQDLLSAAVEYKHDISMNEQIILRNKHLLKTCLG